MKKLQNPIEFEEENGQVKLYGIDEDAYGIMLVGIYEEEYEGLLIRRKVKIHCGLDEEKIEEALQGNDEVIQEALEDIIAIDYENTIEVRNSKNNKGIRINEDFEIDYLI